MDNNDSEQTYEEALQKEQSFNDKPEIIRNKQNYNNIRAFLQEITMFSLHLNGLKIQMHVKEQVLENSDTLNRIVQLQKTWDRINLNLNFNETVRNNLLIDIDKSLDNVAKDFIEVNTHNYQNKAAIVSALSNASNNLNVLKENVYKMVTI